MSSSFRGYLSGLFNHVERSDCTILFYHRQPITSRKPIECGPEASSAEPLAKRQRTVDTAAQQPAQAHATNETTVGEPLPAHLVVVCGGSPLFAAQADRWTQQEGPGSKPVLRVALNAPEDLPFALLSLKFIYTDKLDARSAKELLSIRRLGGYLQVEGCVEACDAALTALISTGLGQLPSQALGGVVDLFLHRSLLPDGDEDRATVRAALHACREQLVRHSGSIKLTDRISAGGPGWGEVLAWAFLDAPSLLSDPTVLEQLCALPMTAMEALLASDSFATDNEATVLLVLAHWLGANATVSNPTRDRLCKLIRVSQLSDTYLHVILPELPWFPISREEHHFMLLYAQASRTKRDCLITVQGSEFDFGSAWYSAARRLRLGKRAIASYDWHVSEQELISELAKEPTLVSMYGTCSNSAHAVVSCGFEWRPWIECEMDADGAYLALSCDLPAALQVPDSASLLGVVCPGPVTLVGYMWREDGAQEEAYTKSFAGTCVQIGYSRGWPNGLPLKPLAEGPVGLMVQRLAAQWAPYLHQGKIHGAIQWR